MHRDGCTANLGCHARASLDLGHAARGMREANLTGLLNATLAGARAVLARDLRGGSGSSRGALEHLFMKFSASAKKLCASSSGTIFLLDLVSSACSSRHERVPEVMCSVRAISAWAALQLKSEALAHLEIHS